MNIQLLLKKLLPGLLPLFVFIIADEIWGTTIGLIVAVGTGVIETIYGYIRNKKVDKFVLADTGLIVLLGLVSILLSNEVFFKLKPALLQTILCVVLAISAFSRQNLILLMSKRYLKGVEMNSKMEKGFQRSLRIMFYIFSMHTILVYYSVFFMSKEAWAFISGGLLYIVFAGYFGYAFLISKHKRKQKPAEWVPLVNEEGKIIGKATREACHSDKNLLHPVVHLHLFDHNKNLFLQKRPLYKKIQPGKWDTAVGGHVDWGESIESALLRESFEEIGLRDFKPVFIKSYVWESDVERELVYVFVAKTEQKPKINHNELSDGKFWSPQEISDNLNQGVFTPNFEAEYPLVKQLF